MTLTVALCLSWAINPSVTVSKSFLLETDSHLGTANRHGTIVFTDRRARLASYDKGIFRTIAMPSMVVSGRPLANGWLVGDQILNQNGDWVRQIKDFRICAMNSKGLVVGHARDARPLTDLVRGVDRAAILKEGFVTFVGPRPDSSFNAMVDSMMLFSEAWDVDEKNRILLTSFPPKLPKSGYPPLQPYILDAGNLKRLPGFEYQADVYPLQFAFDGSILGLAYSESTVPSVNWNGGFGTSYPSYIARWRANAKGAWKSESINIEQDSDMPIRYATVDASGDIILGSALLPNKGNYGSPVLWYKSVLYKASSLRKPKGLDIHSFLGFVKSDIVVALGRLNGKPSLLYLKVQGSI